MEHLKELRKERGLLQRDVAAYLGVDRTTYLKYENGTNEPDIEIIKKLSSFFGVSVDYLLGNSNAVFFSDPRKSYSDSDFVRLSPDDQQYFYDVFSESIRSHRITEGLTIVRSGASSGFFVRLKNHSLSMTTKSELLRVAIFLEVSDDVVSRIKDLPALEERFVSLYKQLHDQIDRIDPDDVETVSEFLQVFSRNRKK